MAVPDIRWITPVFSFLQEEHISVPDNARAKLREMVEQLLGTPGLVAIYVTQGAEEGYGPPGQRGRRQQECRDCDRGGRYYQHGVRARVEPRCGR